MTDYSHPAMTSDTDGRRVQQPLMRPLHQPCDVVRMPGMHGKEMRTHSSTACGGRHGHHMKPPSGGRATAGSTLFRRSVSPC